MKLTKPTPEWFAGKLFSSFSSYSDVTDDDNHDDEISKKHISSSTSTNTPLSARNNKAPKKKRSNQNTTTTTTTNKKSNKNLKVNKNHGRQGKKGSQEREVNYSSSNYHHNNSYYNPDSKLTPMNPSHGELNNLLPAQEKTTYSAQSCDQDVQKKMNYYGSFFTDKIAMDNHDNKKDDSRRKIDPHHHSLQNYSSILLGYSPKKSNHKDRALRDTNDNITKAPPQDYPLGQITDNINVEKNILNSSTSKKYNGRNFRHKKKKKKRNEPNKISPHTSPTITTTHEITASCNHQQNNKNNTMIRSTNDCQTCSTNKNNTSSSSIDFIANKSNDLLGHKGKNETSKCSSAITIPDEIITNPSLLTSPDFGKKTTSSKKSNTKLSPLSPMVSPHVNRGKNLYPKSPPKSNHSDSHHSSHNSGSNYSICRLLQYHHHISPKHSSQHHRMSKKEMIRLRKKVEAAKATEYKIRKIVFGEDDDTVMETVYNNSYDDYDDDSQSNKRTSVADCDIEFGANDNNKIDTHENDQSSPIGPRNKHCSNLKINDWPFAILFYLQLVIIAYIAIRYGSSPTVKTTTYSKNNGNYNWYHQQHSLLVNDHKNENFTSNDRYFNANLEYPDYGYPVSDSNSAPLSNNPRQVPFTNPFAVPEHSYYSGQQNGVWQEEIYVNYENAIEVACITGLYAASLSFMMVGIMMILSKSLIQSLLLLIILLCFGWVIFGMALCPYSFIPVLGSVFLAICSAYTIVVWDRIPFAATNLDTALHGMRCTADILVTGLGAILVALLWNISWSYAFIGVYDHIIFCENNRLLRKEWELLVYMGLIISYIWTFNVILNVVNVTVAGTLGKWWFRPQDVTLFCSTALLEPLTRSLTSSFGSICFGSLVVPPSQVFSIIISTCCLSCRRTIEMGEDNDISSSLRLTEKDRVHGNIDDLTATSIENRSIQSTLLRKLTCGYIDSIFLESLNDFSFTFLGIYYQFNFLKSGKKAAEVFKARDWSETVSDRLIQNALFMASVMIGMMNGLFGILVEEYDGYSFTNFEEPTRAAFLIGSWTGLTLSIVFFNIVNSSVKAILVCFAIGPYEFKQNHRRLSDDMRETWGGFWPDDMV